MPATPRRLLAVLLALQLASVGCGKKGDPQPPLRRVPQGLAAFSVAQHGERVVVSLTAPNAYTDGSRLPVLDVELLRAEREGEFAKLARPRRLRAAPGESLTQNEPLPPPGTPLRYAARVLAKGKASGLTAVVALRVQAPPPAPTGLAAQRSASGLRLDWTALARPAAEVSVPAQTPPPAPEAAPEPAGPTPSPEPAAPASPPAAGVAPALAGPAAPAPPTSGFWVYRRAATGNYADPLAAAPVPASPFEDTEPAAETVCYVVRTVVSTDPVIESADSDEVCVSPAMPAPSPGPGGR